MSRHRRPFCPGLAFHITTRVTGRQALFDTAARGVIVHHLAQASKHTDARILAYAIMPNHLHVVVQQGREPLARLMQPWLRRIALLAQRRDSVEGHVFERRFRAHPCLNAAYVRDAITYAHLNPVRSGSCGDPGLADSTSHHVYSGEAAPSHVAHEFLSPMRELFATDRETNRTDWQRAYTSYVSYRLACDAADEAGTFRPLDPPCNLAGDAFFAVNFAVSADPERILPSRRMDLRDIALTSIATSYNDLSLDALRGRSLRGRQLQELRHRIIREATRAGHAGVAIAAFFGMSPSRVSEIARTS